MNRAREFTLVACRSLQMKPEIIRFDQSVCSRLDLALSREWLETNGLGGFASSTLIGLNTRRYHGLLTASTTPPSGRVVLLSKLEETVIVEDQRYELSANQYPGAIHPQGYQNLKEFRLDHAAYRASPAAVEAGRNRYHRRSAL